MTLCVESFIGDAAVGVGIKLEQPMLVTDAGTGLMSDFAFEDDLLGREV